MFRRKLAEPPGLLESRWRGHAGVALLGASACGGMAGKVVRNRGTGNGFVFQSADYEGGICNGLEFIRSHGGEVLDPNDASKVILDSTEMVAALTTERSMVSEGGGPAGRGQLHGDESAVIFICYTRPEEIVETLQDELQQIVERDQ